MSLANELFEAAELTGIARAELESLEEQEASHSLAQYLPNERVHSAYATYHTHETAQNDLARYRAFDAEPERGRSAGGGEKSVRLPAVSQTQAVSEQTQVNLGSLSDGAIRTHIEGLLRNIVKSIFNRTNLQRAHVLETGRAEVNQPNYKLNDDFGRHPDLTTTAPNLWSNAATNRLDYLLQLAELYSQHAGQDAGAIVMGRRVMSQLVRGQEFAVELANGSQRAGNQTEVLAFLQAAGLPPVYVINSRVGGQPLISDDVLLMLPAPVHPENPEDTELGSTVWGVTAVSQAASFGIEDSEWPGIVAGVDTQDRVPYLHEVFGDSVNLPVLKTPNLSLCAKVL